MTLRLANSLLSATVLLVLTACSSPSSSYFYQLPAPSQNQLAPGVTMDKQAADNSHADKSLFIEPVKVASYLSGRGLVLQTSAVELVMARQHLWAEALDQQLQRQLRQHLSQLAPAYAVQLQPGAHSTRLWLQLDSFHGSADGYALLSGHFLLSGQPLSQPFSYRVPLTDDGYPALVAALGQGVQQLSQQIAAQLTP
ncbi:MAG: ABC-type transport auxiliary lipoprotein family protein [Chromatiaceae bacterium]|nr:ABC-type transport auxiliary lipoprotein family protein [Chromatiaceae bacterium]